VFFFFHPLVWLAMREWRLSQEIAADQLAVSTARLDVARYAGCLLELVERCRTPMLSSHLAVSVSETYAQLSRRMLAMESFQSVTVGWRIAATLLVTVAVCSVAPWKLTARETPARPAAVAAADELQTADEPAAKAPPAGERELLQAQAIAEIQKLGGEIVYDKVTPGRPAISVALNNGKVNDSILERLSAFTSLKVLMLDGTKVTDAGLVHLAGLKDLWVLELNSTQITDAGLAHLAGLTKLHNFGLIQTRITDAGLVVLERMPHLGMLLLGSNDITDAGLVHVRGLTRLQTLGIDGTKITDAGLAQLVNLKDLRDLRLNDTRVSDAGLERLKGLTALQLLVLNSTKVTGAGLAHLTELPELQSLWLSDSSITDAGLAHVKGLTNLQTLVLRKTRITDAGLEHLRGLAGLRMLDLDNTGTSDAAVKKLQRGLPACRIIWEGPTPTLDELVDRFTSAEYDWQQAEVGRELVANGDPRLIPRLTKLLKIEDHRRRCNVGMVLAGLGDPRGLGAIIRELEDKNPRPSTDLKKSDGTPDAGRQIANDRYHAAVLLGRLKDKDAVPALIEATTDKTINYGAAISLAEIGDKSAIPALRKMAADFPDQELWAGYGLAALGEQQGFDILTETALNDERWTQRRHAVEALGKFGNSKVLPTLLKALTETHVNVRVSAAKSLGQIGDPAALPALTEALNDTETTQVNAPTTVATEARKAIDAINRKAK
jgi:HEAT repeat protein